MDKTAENMTPEWSYLFQVEDLQEKPLDLEIKPDAGQCRDLLTRLQLESIDNAVASMTLSWLGSRLHVRGVVKADVTQKCVVTLDPVEDHVEEPFEAWFVNTEGAVSFSRAKRDRHSNKGRHEMPIMDEVEDPEPIIEGVVDLGELATQYLSLGLNVYPHVEGAQFENPTAKEAEADDEAEALRKNPFLALKKWKDSL